MGFTSRDLSTQRQVVYDLIHRAKQNHASVSACFDWDVTETLARLEADKAAGREVGLAAFMVKASSMAIAEHPVLNRRLFKGWFRRKLVDWDEISCNVIVEREGARGESVVFPAVLRHTDQLTVEAIHGEIRRLKQSPLDGLDALEGRRRLGRMPRLGLTLLNWLVTHRPGFFIKHFGTFNLSAIIHRGSGVLGGSVLSTSTTVYPTDIRDKPVVVDGEIVVRTMMMVTVCVDHFVVDGMEAYRACRALQRLVEEPTHVLGPSPCP